jgi:KUP system potassium uptake protein
MATPERSTTPLALLALGVVFGDIGTSPLYALRMCFAPGIGLQPTPETVLGILSLVFWSLMAVVSLKYLAYLLRADLYGEGGILALMTLACPPERQAGVRGAILLGLGIFGAALLYGDGMITPAISVLSAVEGLSVVTEKLSLFVVPITLGVLIALFAMQKQGTAKVATLFGPIMLIWFATIFILGMNWIVKAPEILYAVDPRHGVALFRSDPVTTFRILGFVFLVVTGGEALYADLGHFGKRSIRQAWFFVALPAILVNYFGQGAFLLRQPKLAGHSFYNLAPEWALIPLVALATFAAVIASQAIITGAFSLTYQCIRLGFAPRLKVLHYAEDGEGRVYLPWVNGALLVACCTLVLGFRSSAALASAYGIAVATTMVITTLLGFATFTRRWGWMLAGLATAGLLAFDLPFFASNLMKLDQGGWVPLVVSGAIFIVLMTWRRGQALELKRLEKQRLSNQGLLDAMVETPPVRVPGTAVFLDPESAGAPRTLVRNLIHNRVLHEKVIIFTVTTDAVPRVPASERVETFEISPDVLRVNAHYGYMQLPNVPLVLRGLEQPGFEYNAENTTFFLGGELLTLSRSSELPLWRKRLYAFLSRNQPSATDQYRLPPDRVMIVSARLPL